MSLSGWGGKDPFSIISILDGFFGFIKSSDCKKNSPDYDKCKNDQFKNKSLYSSAAAGGLISTIILIIGGSGLMIYGIKG
jgi:hypothetical protein